MDWIPKKELEFAALCRKWLPALNSEQARTEFHWESATTDEVAATIDTYLEAATACAAVDSSANRLAKKEAKRKAQKAMRMFATTSVRNNLYMDNVERLEMGMRSPDTVPTQHARPESQPKTTVGNTSNNYEHKVVAVNRDNNRATKPADAYGVRFAWQVGGERPAAGEDLPKDKFSRKPVFTVVHRESDKGKPAFYATCYENSRGEKGPWSPVEEAYIS